MNTDKTEIEKYLKESHASFIQLLIAGIYDNLKFFIVMAILILTNKISAMAQLNLEVKLNEKEYFEAFANYILTSSSEWFLPLYSTLGIWGFITVAIPVLFFVVIFWLVKEIDELIKSRGVSVLYRLPRVLILLSAFMLLIFAFYTKTFIDNNPIAKAALDRAVTMHQVKFAIRYIAECNEDNDESRKQCKRIVESILAGQK